ncbi:putative Transmembrane protein 177 [Hypsibius exemplaris]|uniref:Transmembrane protein 177 n=1 Tax=Hypsibius exemplaris TaxID=2072580 RepID=A0A1W0WMM3_HYPEX|nr:putative Transmembrane protein 177 [Hypsibius exemplaris]
MSAANRFAQGRGLLHYLGTEPGRTKLFFASGVAGLASALLVGVPHAPAINWMKNTLQMYKDGYPVKLSPSVIDLAAEVLADLKVKERDAKTIRWFTAFGFDPIHKGATHLRSGAIIGIPRTFSYNSPEDVDRSLIKLHRDISIPWKTEAGEALMAGIIYSDKARKFAIAREVVGVDSYHVITKFFAVGLVIPSVSSLLARLDDRIQLYRYPLRMRVAWFSAWSVVAVLAVAATWDAVCRYYESDADRTVAAMGVEYLEGGVEYYAKRLLMNRALRELLGKEGRDTYSEAGDVRYLLWEPRLPLTQQRAFFEKKLAAARSAQVVAEVKQNENEDSREAKPV